MKIGLIKEGKTPPDERVPLTPKQCKLIVENYPDVEIKVQKSEIRRIKDEEYAALDFPLVDNLNDCDVIMGVKEVPIDMLYEGKTHFFFSHTIKMQPYNRKLLQAVLRKKVRLIDYETLTNKNGKRLIGFGRYAGIVGCYNAFYTWGRRFHSFDLERAYQCEDRAEMENELKLIKIPENIKIVLTGGGRVAGGAMEILNKIGVEKISPEDFLTKTYNHPVFAQIDINHYVKRKDDQSFTHQDFFHNPTDFESNFMQYAKVADMYISAHFWDERAPFIFTREDAKSKDFHIKVVADISCDIDGPVASTIRPSTIKDPVYGYNPQTESETAVDDLDAISVMAVDNLPCELPKDASRDFGKELLKNVLPHLLGEDKDEVIKRATIAENGRLTERYSYLQDYVNG